MRVCRHKFDCLKIHENIRKIRQWKNIPQKQISDETGIAQSVLSRIEQGTDFRWSQLVKISASLGLTPEEIICFNPKVVFNQIGKHSKGMVINQGTDSQTE